VTTPQDHAKCIDCKKRAPTTQSDYTLISAQFGWRLSRTQLPNGTYEVDWRCPECWAAYKKRTRPFATTGEFGSEARTDPGKAATPPSTSGRPPPSKR
jgi:hypothetical protein